MGGVIFCLLSFGEYFILDKYGLNAKRDHYLSTTFLAVSIFMIALKANSRELLFSRLGRDYSLYIYVFHIAIFMAMPYVNSIFFSETWMMNIYPYMAPAVILFETILFVFLLRKISLIK